MSKWYTAEPVGVICVDDPAIDEEATGKEALILYTATRDIELIKTYEGVRPAVFFVAQLTSTQMSQIKRTTSSDDGRYELAFKFGVTRATDVPCKDGITRSEFVPRWRSSPRPKQVQCLTEAEFNLFSDDHIAEIGRVVYDRAPLVPGKPIFFGLPHSSALALERMELSHRLAAILRRGTHDNEAASSETDPKND